MKKVISTKNKIIFASILAAVLFGVSLLVLFVTTISRDYNIYNIKVNGIESEKHGDKFIVNINQSKYINISCDIRDDKCKVHCFTDENLSEENIDLSRVYIGGVDTEIYLVVKEGDKIRRTERIRIKNIIPDDEEFSFSVNGILPQKNENGYKISLPYGTSEIDLSAIKIGSNFSYTVYYDQARKQPVENLKNIEIRDKRTILYVDIGNVNVAEVVKSFTITIQTEDSTENSVLSLKANGIDANINGQHISLSLKKAKTIRLELFTSEHSQFKLYHDREKTNEIDDITNIDVAENFSEMTLYLDVIAENGSTKFYNISIGFILENNTNIEYITINGVQGQFNGNEVLFLLNRATSLEIDLKTSSPNAKAAFYYDRGLTNEISDIKNIDIHSLTEAVYQIFFVVTSEDGTQRVYSVTVNFVPSANCELIDLKINNRSLKFENGIAEIEFEGVPESFLLNFQEVKVSPAATCKTFYDRHCTNELEQLDSIKMTSAVQSFYIDVVAENTENHFVYEVTIKLISNDNALKSITINNQEHLINADTVDIIIDSNDTISVNSIKHDEKAEVSLYYDILQTQPVIDRNNILYENNRTELYLRVVAENLSVKVYHLRLEIKAAPQIIFNYSIVQLQEWQSQLKISELFAIQNNAYSNGQFEVEVYWDGVRQNTESITVDNEDRFYDLKIKIVSLYFQEFESTKSIQILPYVLRPIQSKLNILDIETKEDTISLTLKDLIHLDDGSFTIGQHYFVEVWSDNNDVQVIVDKEAHVLLRGGVYKIYLNAFRNLFDDIKVGEIAVKVLEKVKPVIIAPAYLEYEVSERQIKLEELFEIVRNDYDILLVQTFVNDIESEFLTCQAGIYDIRLQAYYNGGMIEKSLRIEIASISDNASADIFINQSKITVDNEPVILDELNYNENLTLDVLNFNSKATVQVFVNGSEVSLGDLNLASGLNEIKVVVTAESSRVQEYILKVNKRERKLPAIETIDKTIKLEKNQTFVSFGNYYSLTLNDYDADTKLYHNGNEIYGDVLQVGNFNKIYSIEIRLIGEFGTISKILNIGVLAYTEIEINYNATTISAKTDYVYSEKDFVKDILFYGIDSSLCRTVILLDGERFVSLALDEGTYYVTVQVWQDEILLKEESVWFTVKHTEDVNPVTVIQINKETVIDEKSVTPNIEDFFTIQYGRHEPSSVNISFIYNEIGAAQSLFKLVPGNNYISIVLTDRKSDAELFRGKFVIKCNYVAKSATVFSSVKINDREIKIKDNDLILLNEAPLIDVTVSYITNSGITVYGLLSEYSLKQGFNIINYFVQEDFYSFNGTLNIYNLSNIKYYLNSISYNGILVENNVLLLDEGTFFDLEGLSVTYNESNHISIKKEMKKYADNIYDVTIGADYDGIAIGTVVFRVFIGKQTPRLNEVVVSLNGNDVAFYGINEFSLDVLAVTDAGFLNIITVFTDGKYTSEIKFENLTVGENLCSFSVWENKAVEYVYSAKVTIIPKTIIKSLSYEGMTLTEVNHRFIIESKILDASKISWILTDNAAGLDLVFVSNEVLFNGKIVGCNFVIFYNFIDIYNFSVILDNNNTSVNVERGGKALAQSGSTLFKDETKIEKSTAQDSIIVRYLVKPIYPYATVEGSCITNEELGYFLTVDLSGMNLYEVGTYTNSYTFIVNGVSGKTEYTLFLDVSVTDLNEADADVVVIGNSTQKLLFAEKDLSLPIITAKNKLSVSIFDKTIEIEINGRLGYRIYQNGVVVDKITVPFLFSGSEYYIEFQIGVNIEALKTMKIYLNPCKDESGKIIETALTINGEEVMFYEEGVTQEIDYNGNRYSVLTANKTLIMPVGSTEITAECFGYLLEYGGFVFEGNTTGSLGTLKIIDNKILLLFHDGSTIIPYGILDVEFV